MIDYFCSCYANVVLQCLAFTRPLISYLIRGLHSKACKFCATPNPIFLPILSTLYVEYLILVAELLQVERRVGVLFVSLNS